MLFAGLGLTVFEDVGNGMVKRFGAIDRYRPGRRGWGYEPIVDSERYSWPQITTPDKYYWNVGMTDEVRGRLGLGQIRVYMDGHAKAVYYPPPGRMFPAERLFETVEALAQHHGLTLDEIVAQAGKDFDGSWWYDDDAALAVLRGER